MMKVNKFRNIGIAGYGYYIPGYRVEVAEIARAYKVDGENVESGLGVKQKSVADWDEDSVTMAYEAAKRALDLGKVEAGKIGALYIGSESHPYAVKPSSTIVADALGMDSKYMAADLEFACKAGTAGMQIIASHLQAGVIDYGLAIGADKAQAEPRDVLEYTAACGAAAILMGKRNLIAKLEGFLSYSSDTGDFWRRDGQKYPSHAGRFTGEPAYFKHVINATELYLKSIGNKVEDFNYLVLHMPNGKFPKRAAKRLGFSEKQTELGFNVADVGNPYSASSLIGLCKVLEKAKTGERILLTSYGSGSGSDTFSFKVTKNLEIMRRKQKQCFSSTKQLSYSEYRIMID